MRRLLIIAWIAAGLAGVFWWSRHGGTWRALELAEREVQQARLAASQGRWDDAERRYEAAIALLPGGAAGVQADLLAIRVERLHAQARTGKLFQSVAALEEVLATTDARTIDDSGVRTELASQSLYAAWLMRRNGLPQSRWQPFVETARQNLLLLSDRSSDSPSSLATARANLERVRLFQAASDSAVRDEAFPEPDLLKSRIPGEPSADASAMPSRGAPPPSFGTAPNDGGGPPTNPKGGGW